MSYSSIHIAIRDIIEKHGAEIITDFRLMYILSDYAVFDRLSNQHDIVKDLLSKGYGKILFDCKSDNSSEWQLKVGDFINAFLSDHPGYDATEVIYLCDSIAFGVGLLPEHSIRKGSTRPNQSNNSAPIDYASELKKCQKEYISLLKSLIVVPEGKLFRKPSGYFPVEAQNKLFFLKQKIWLLGQELGKDLDSWCDEEKQKVLDENAHPIAPQRLGLLSVIVAPVVAIIILVTSLISYLGAKDSIMSFNKCISYADSLYWEKDYLAAADAYKLTGENYNESYKRFKYKGIARSGEQKALTDLLLDYLNKAQAFYNNNDYLEALKVMNSIPDRIDCSFDNKLAKRLTAMRTDLNAKCEILITTEMDDFIKAIANNKGKPSADVLSRIDYLLTVDPSNYWLNFIKNKSAQK